MKLVVVRENNERTIVAPTGGCMVACERHFGKAIPEMVVGFEVLAFLAWDQTRRDTMGTPIEGFDKWLDGLVDIEIEDGDGGSPLAASQ